MTRILLILILVGLVISPRIFLPPKIQASDHTLNLSPTRGIPDSSFTISGTGFSGNSVASITFGSVPLDDVIVDASGIWSETFLVPKTVGGLHTVTATDSDTPLDAPTQTFTVEPTATIDRSRGSVGTMIAVSGEGFGPSEDVSIKIDGAVILNRTASPIGTLPTSFFAIPALPSGLYTITIGNSITKHFTITPTFTVSPTSGPSGTAVSVSGTGLTRSATADLTIAGFLIQSITTTDQGSLSSSVQIPQIAGGTHTITASGLGSSQTTFKITPTLSADRSNTSPGATVVMAGTGFGANETNIKINFGNETVQTGIVADEQGRWSGDFIVPTATAGSHRVKASGSFTTESSVPEVTMTIGAGVSLDRTSGPPGTILKVSGSGVRASERITVTVGDSTETTETFANTNGVWSADVTVPIGPKTSILVYASGTTSQTTSTTFNVTSAVSVSDQTGVPGSSITLNGEGFGANQTGIPIKFDDSIVTSVNADFQGSWTSTFPIPPFPKGTYQLDIAGSTTILQIPFSITPGISMSSVHGSPTDSVTVTGSGFGANERGISMTLGDSIISSGLSADSNGSWSVIFSVPTLPAGTYRVVASGTQTSVASVRDELFTLAFDMGISISSGSPGNLVGVDGRGFEANGQGLVITYDEVPVVSGITTDAQGGFKTSFVVPPSATGRHSIVVTGPNEFGIPTSDIGFQVSPTIEIDHANGSPGDEVTVKGSGFGVNEKNISLTYANARLPVAVAADAAGSFEVIVTVPSSAKGVHTIQAIGPITASAARPKQSYVIGPILALSKSTGHVAMGVEVRGRGFEPLSTVDLNVSDVRQASLVTDDTGSFEFTDKIPALASGKHFFTAADQSGNRVQSTFVVENKPPEAPTLISPQTGEKGGLFGGFKPVTKWAEVQDLSGVFYSLEIARDRDFFDIVLSKDSLINPAYALTDLESLPRGKYFWRVRAIDRALNKSPWSTGFILQSGIIPIWLVFLLVVIVLASFGGGGYGYFIYRKKQVPQAPEQVHVTRPEIGAVPALQPRPPQTPVLTAPPRRALPSPFRKTREPSAEEQTQLKLILDFVRSLPLLEVTDDLNWIEELVDQQDGSNDYVCEQVLMGPIDLTYEPPWMQHPTYSELRNNAQAQTFVLRLEEYVGAVNECALDISALLRQVYGSMTVALGVEPLGDGQWRLALSVTQSTMSWFRGTYLGQPSTRDYQINSEPEEDGIASLYGSEATPFPGPLLERISEGDALFFRDLHIQLRNVYRSNDDARLLAAKLTTTDALREQLTQAIDQLSEI